MASPKLFKAADYGSEPTLLLSSARGGPSYQAATVSWTIPTLWKRGTKPSLPVGQASFLYIIVRDHHAAGDRDRIFYIGLTTNPRARFQNHPKAEQILARRGDCYLSVGAVAISNVKFEANRQKTALEELEHLYIWLLWNKDIENSNKQYTVPGLGQNGGHAWHITNEGYMFSGKMPREIVYPWMLVKPSARSMPQRVPLKAR